MESVRPHLIAILNRVAASGGEQIHLGSDLKDGIEVAVPGRWIVEPLREPR